MNSKEKQLLEQLRSYILILDDIENLKEDLAHAGYTMTANYSFNGGGFGGYNGSKVETLGNRRLDLERELKRKESIIQQIDEARRNAGLVEREWVLIEHTIHGGSLSSYARKKNIYKSHVYKIRDNALRKMVRYIQENTK